MWPNKRFRRARIGFPQLREFEHEVIRDAREHKMPTIIFRGKWSAKGRPGVGGPESRRINSAAAAHSPERCYSSTPLLARSLVALAQPVISATCPTQVISALPLFTLPPRAFPLTRSLVR